MDISPEMTAALEGLSGVSVLEESLLPDFGIDGQVPSLVLRPESVEAVSSALSWANQNGLAVVPWGNGTLMHIGAKPQRYDVALKLDLLNEVIDYPAADMTITAGAGVCLGALREVVAQEGQFIPLDTPRAAEATLGGLVATNAGGPLRFTEGTLRDMLLGLKVVQADGTVVKAGGRVVKNVAGYDLCRLYNGSLGTLGVIVEVTLRVRPKPEAEATVWCELDDPEAAEPAIAAILESELTPVFIEYLNAPGAESVGPKGLDGWAGGRPALVLGLDGAPEDAAWQIEELPKVIGAEQSQAVLRLEAEVQTEVRERLSNFRNPTDCLLIGKAGILSSEVIRFIGQAGAAGADDGLAVEAEAHAANGIVYLKMRGSLPEDAQVEVLGKWDQLARDCGGSFVIESASPSVKERVDVWGPTRGDIHLMRSIKKTLDPNGTLSPGRFVGGI